MINIFQRSSFPNWIVSNIFPRQTNFKPSISEENIARYCSGGYHPVRIGDTFHGGRYKVVNKLGYGVHSTVWLVHDIQQNNHVALKILTAASSFKTLELEILKHMKTIDSSHPGAVHVLGLEENFVHQGPNGEHICLVFKAMGPDFSKYRRLFSTLKVPMPVLQDISTQLLLALAYLHDFCKVIHTDIKPQNILIETPEIELMFEQTLSEDFMPDVPPMKPPNDFYMLSEQISSVEEDLSATKEISIKLTDFGTSSWFGKHLTEWIQPDMLRAPEVILGMKWDYKVDIWNLGLILWELAEGQYLFDGCATATASYTADAHLSQMQATLGQFPKAMLEKGELAKRYFDEYGNLLRPTLLSQRSLEELSKSPEMREIERKDFLEFIGSMIRLLPEERPDARDLLNARWLRGNGNSTTD